MSSHLNDLVSISESVECKNSLKLKLTTKLGFKMFFKKYFPEKVIVALNDTSENR